MASRDLLNKFHTAPAIAPQAVVNSNAPVIGSIVDTFGYEAAMLCVQVGAITAPGATFTATLEHGDDPALADSSAPDVADLVGALPSFTGNDSSKTRKIGYVGSKRYLRLSVTPSGNGAGSASFAAVAALGHPRLAPTPNPPQA